MQVPHCMQGMASKVQAFQGACLGCSAPALRLGKAPLWFSALSHDELVSKSIGLAGSTIAALRSCVADVVSGVAVHVMAPFAHCLGGPFNPFRTAEWSRQQPLPPRAVQSARPRLTRRHEHRPPSIKADASSTRGGGPYGGSGGLGGGGGGSGRGDGEEHSDDAPSQGGLFLGWAGWQERVAADPSFPYKVFIEQIIGVGAAVVGDMSSRPYWGLYELDFVFSTLVVGSIVNFSLMYFLAPTAGTTAAGANLLQKLFSEQTLLAWGAPGGHMFQAGSFPVAKRLVNLGYKGLVFAIVGFAAGIIGTATSNVLLAVRKRLDSSFESQNKAPNVLLNAGVWATHMGVSSNIRYQMLNGLDMVMQSTLSPSTFRLLTSILRTVNNVLGGISFVVLAKVFGVQSSAGDEKKTCAKALPVAAKEH